jgi:hypothetical protein
MANYTPPSSKQHPPGRKVGGQHTIKLTNHGGDSPKTHANAVVRPPNGIRNPKS